MTWNEFWDTIVNFLATSGLQVLYGILVLIAGLILIKLLMKLINRILLRTKLERITQGFIKSIVKVLLYAVLIFAVLQMFGIPMTGLVTVLATAGAAIALSLKDSLSHVASGMILISNKPFHQGDYIQVDNLEGTVKSIKIMNTEIVTTDNKTVILPNSTILNSNLINYSREGIRRFEMTFEVAFETDINLAKKVLLDVCRSNGKIHLTPEPEVHLKELTDSGLQLFLTFWSKGPYWEIYFYVMEHAYNEFKRNKISLSYGQLEVHMRTDNAVLPYDSEPLPERVEQQPKEDDTEENFIDKIFDAKTYNTKNIKSRKKKKLEKKQQKIEQQLLALQEKETKNETNVAETTTTSPVEITTSNKTIDATNDNQTETKNTKTEENK